MHPTRDPDEAARLVRSGSASAFGDLVAATTPRLYRLAVRMTGSPEEAEDVLQDSYIRAYEALRSGAFDGTARVESWLYRIVTNTALNALRSRRHRAEGPLGDDVGVIGDDGLTAQARVALRELAGWLHELPAEQLAAVVLKEIEGLTSAEAAAALGCTEGAVEQRLVRARTTLRARSGS